MKKITILFLGAIYIACALTIGMFFEKAGQPFTLETILIDLIAAALGTILVTLYTQLP